MQCYNGVSFLIRTNILIRQHEKSTSRKYHEIDNIYSDQSSELLDHPITTFDKMTDGPMVSPTDPKKHRDKHRRQRYAIMGAQQRDIRHE